MHLNLFFLILGIHQQGFGNSVLSPKFLGKWGGGGGGVDNKLM